MYHNCSRTLCEAALATAISIGLDLVPTPTFSCPNLPLGHPSSSAQLINYRQCKNTNRFVICDWVHASSSKAVNTQRRRHTLDVRYESAVHQKRTNEEKEWQ
jgi:hypothetical protein